jgi:hypothetical protein
MPVQISATACRDADKFTLKARSYRSNSVMFGLQATHWGTASQSLACGDLVVTSGSCDEFPTMTADHNERGCVASMCKRGLEGEEAAYCCSFRVWWLATAFPLLVRGALAPQSYLLWTWPQTPALLIGLHLSSLLLTHALGGHRHCRIRRQFTYHIVIAL